MFSPIASYPIGVLSIGATDYASASGTFDASGAATGTVRVAGSASTTFALTGTATAQGGRVERGSWLGFGPIGYGAIGELLSIAAPITSVSGTASGTFGFTGAAASKVLITGRAPDIVLTPWSITPGDASGTINTFPLPPATPAWAVSIGAPGFTILSYPNYNSTVPNIPFFDLIGSASISSPIYGAGADTLTFAGISSALAKVTGAAADAFTLTGASDAISRIAGSGSGAISFDGTATGRIGVIPVTGTASGDFDLPGTGIITIAHNVYAQAIFDLIGNASGGVLIAGQGNTVFDLFGVSVISKLSERRLAFPRESKNRARVLSQQEAAKLLDR